MQALLCFFDLRHHWRPLRGRESDGERSRQFEGRYCEACGLTQRREGAWFVVERRG